MRPILLLALAACTSSSTGDIVGPFTGPVTRFAIDRITLPTNNATARQLADDLDGNGAVDNQLGLVIGTLTTNNDTTTHAADMIASGAIESSLLLQAPDLTSAAKAGATYLGSDDADAVVMGGDIVEGVFVSNRTRTTRVPGMAVVHVPVFADADPSIVEVDAMELDLTPDGSGGYDALVHGAVPPDAAFSAVCAALPQMIYADPNDHYVLAGEADLNRDGVISCDEIRDNSLFQSMLAPDVKLDGQPMVSFGFGMHLVPCDSGACARGTPADPCHDRVQDNGETGIDCGGSCGPCPVAQPSCSDGVRDGLETDVDCGWNCPTCALGKQCWSGLDCASGACSGQGTLGTCIIKAAQ